MKRHAGRLVDEDEERSASFSSASSSDSADDGDEQQQPAKRARTTAGVAATERQRTDARDRLTANACLKHIEGCVPVRNSTRVRAQTANLKPALAGIRAAYEELLNDLPTCSHWLPSLAALSGAPGRPFAELSSAPLQQLFRRWHVVSADGQVTTSAPNGCLYRYVSWQIRSRTLTGCRCILYGPQWAQAFHRCNLCVDAAARDKRRVLRAAWAFPRNTKSGESSAAQLEWPFLVPLPLAVASGLDDCPGYEWLLLDYSTFAALVRDMSGPLDAHTGRFLERFSQCHDNWLRSLQLFSAETQNVGTASTAWVAYQELAKQMAAARANGAPGTRKVPPKKQQQQQRPARPPRQGPAAPALLEEPSEAETRFLYALETIRAGDAHVYGNTGQPPPQPSPPAIHEHVVRAVVVYGTTIAAQHHAESTLLHSSVVSFSNSAPVRDMCHMLDARLAVVRAALAVTPVRMFTGLAPQERDALAALLQTLRDLEAEQAAYDAQFASWQPRRPLIEAYLDLLRKDVVRAGTALIDTIRVSYGAEADVFFADDFFRTDARAKVLVGVFDDTVLRAATYSGCAACGHPFVFAATTRLSCPICGTLPDAPASSLFLPPPPPPPAAEPREDKNEGAPPPPASPSAVSQAVDSSLDFAGMVFPPEAMDNNAPMSPMSDGRFYFDSDQ